MTRQDRQVHDLQERVRALESYVDAAKETNRRSNRVLLEYIQSNFLSGIAAAQLDEEDVK